jgi:hypothetical protein
MWPGRGWYSYLSVGIKLGQFHSSKNVK